MLKITLTLETGGFAMNCRHVIVCLSAITIAMLVSVSCRNQPQVDLDWIDIAGGSFEMGNPDASSNDPYEQNYLETEVPVHEVTVPDFKMLKSEVTVEQYKACVDAGICTEPAIGEFATWNTEGMEEHPVNYVSWYQAVEFCDWVEGRLPTEMEWEYAARNKGADLYPWGDAAATCEYAVMKEDVSGCGTAETWPVCSKAEGNTEDGLCDMIGNLFEWTLDWYQPNYEGAPVDGSAWVVPRGKTRVMRGGALSYNSFWQRATARGDHGGPSYQVYTLGFRCVQGVAVDGDYDAPRDDDDECDGDDTRTDFDWSCLEDACENPDGNTHDDCGCSADWCAPDIRGIEMASITPLTCTPTGCCPSNPLSCPEGYNCIIIPDFVPDIFEDEGIIFPTSICGRVN